MSVWVLHQSLTPEEEARITERTHLILPFEGLPDLTPITSQAGARQLLELLYPDEPPEALSRRLERFWNHFTALGKEDTIGVPLPGLKQLALAEVTGPYEYRIGAEGEDIHLIPVKWYHRSIRYMTLHKHKELLASGGPALREVTHQDARVLIRDRLPHRYNRFARWKWLLALMFALGLVRMLMHIDQP
jgi:predicted Mrr-cat superfamily restriction endonuclease